jgi:hypothetical protein
MTGTASLLEDIHAEQVSHVIRNWCQAGAIYQANRLRYWTCQGITSQ